MVAELNAIQIPNAPTGTAKRKPRRSDSPSNPSKEKTWRQKLLDGELG